MISLVGQPVAEVFLLRVAAQVLERQDDEDGLPRRGGPLLHRRDEPVAELGHRLDVRRVAQRLAQREDVLRQRGFGDAGAGPHPVHQLVLADGASRVFHQHEQRVEGLRRERQHRPAAPQPALGGLQTEGAELVDFQGDTALTEI